MESSNRHRPGSHHVVPLRNPLLANAHAPKNLANQMFSSAKHEHRHDDLHDLVGSNSPTPSGVETPRPDLHDKRFPGIQSYFGQVGRDPSQNTALRSLQAITNPIPDATEQNAPLTLREEEKKVESRRGSSASLGSMVMVEREQHSVPTPPPDEPYQGSQRRVTEVDTSRLPPTPVSSAASVMNRDGEVAENGGSMLDGGLASITQALRNFVLPKSASGVKDRRHQSLPVSSVTRSTVPAAYISNPTSSRRSSRSKNPRSSSPSHAKPPSSEILRESDELTSSVAPAPREKSTPPHTPRALSQEDYRRTDTRSPLSSTSTTVGDGNAQVEKPQRPKHQIHTAITTPRGKLKIKIAEGRNLKPSFDPYVVCQFEWNEYVSKGVRPDPMDVDTEESKGPTLQLQSIPIRRTDSDMGKPMAIPMKSRQSSTNGTDGDQGLNKVTDPQWEHHAIL